ncbi:MAG: thioredoxin-like protein [Actinomycetia bacterium]|nr:thioredoxin-like protein [Actinomycetes bacterium]
MAPMTEVPSPILTISPRAMKKVLEIRAGEEGGDTLALWVEVVGIAGEEWAYDLFFDIPGEATADDAVQHSDDLTVVIPAESIERISGATLDMSRDLLNPGLVIVNPHKPPQAPKPESAPISVPDAASLSGPVAERVQTVLEQHVNPSIASHGGTATLVAVEDDTAYLRLGGGCVGCGMAAVTLTQGISVAIKQAVPEILNVVDVTDHASGTNPYYEAAKK